MIACASILWSRPMVEQSEGSSDPLAELRQQLFVEFTTLANQLSAVRAQWAAVGQLVDEVTRAATAESHVDNIEGA